MPSCSSAPTWFIQRQAHEAMFSPDYHLHGYSPSLSECLAQAKVERMDGDFDVFGDGSVKVISTPGHCSLQVRLPKAGPILLSGDVAHYRFNLEHRCGRP
jgi:N-acyl homoserine lactone hydrolase